MNPPGVYFTENDQSPYAPQASTNVCAMLGTASKGPVNERTLITDEGTLVATFGNPSATHLALYSAIEYLRRGKVLWFVRVADYDVAASGVIRNAGDSADAIAIAAVSTGSWGNNIGVVVADGTDTDTYRITVTYGGVVVESYDRVLLGTANAALANYISTRINGISAYIAVTPDDAETTLLAGTVTLTAGDDGSTVTDADYVGTAGNPPTTEATGLQLFADADVVNIDILAVPGNSNAAVIAAATTIAETRKDCVYLVDPPAGMPVGGATGVVYWSNTVNGGLNSSYVDLCYGWQWVKDGYTSVQVLTPPSGFRAAVYAYTDEVAFPWFAPMGYERGLLSSVIAPEHSPTAGEQAYMYTNGNIVNPIVSFAGKGIVMWGQRTATRTASKLDRVNVRRLMNYLRKTIKPALYVVIGMPNDELTWLMVKNIISPVLAYVAANRGLTATTDLPFGYSVICDETTNTAVVRANKELRAKVFVVPTDTVEVVSVEFVITDGGIYVA